jgi:hypothetical protein
LEANTLDNSTIINRVRKDKGNLSDSAYPYASRITFFDSSTTGGHAVVFPTMVFIDKGVESLIFTGNIAKTSQDY